MAMANAATIAPAGSTFTTTGSMTVKSPATFNMPVTCNLTMSGSVINSGAAALITSAVFSGSNAICAIPVASNFAWFLTLTGPGPDVFSGTLGALKLKIISDCSSSPVIINVNWKNTTNTLSIPSPQTVGACTITGLSASPTPAFTVSP
ncbi:alkane oxidation protein activator PraB [Pseudomonas sp. S1_E04]